MGSLARFLIGKVGPRFTGARAMLAGTTRAARRSVVRTIAQTKTRQGRKKLLKKAAGWTLSIGSVAAVSGALQDDGQDPALKLKAIQEALKDTVPGIESVRTLTEAVDLIKLYSLQQSLANVKEDTLPSLFREAAEIVRCAQRVANGSRPSYNVATTTLSEKRQLSRYSEDLRSCLYLIGYFLGALDVDALLNVDDEGPSVLEDLLKGAALARSGVNYGEVLANVPTSAAEFYEFRTAKVREQLEEELTQGSGSVLAMDSSPRDLLMWILDTYM